MSNADSGLRLHVVSAKSVASMVRDAITADRDGLRAAVRAAVADLDGSGPAAPVTVAGGGWPIIAPNSDGTWPKVTPVNDGRVYEWIRYYGTGQLAPMPTPADGLLDGHVITPVLDGEITGPRVLWSDSLTGTGASVGASRAGAPYDGGDVPYWVSDTTRQPDGRVRVMAEGMELYSMGVAWVEEPTMPTTGSIRTSWQFGAFAANNSLLFLLRGSNVTDPNRIELKIKNEAGQLTFNAVNAATSTATKIGTGSLPFSASTRVVVDTHPDKVVVTADSTTVGEFTFPSGAPSRPTFATWSVEQWNSATITRVKQETL